ncbi:hypothetical protein PHOSAC3_120510 [Mesotoga infera]|nr:hypothetical protein PHOSAC3_120510 [Mesotoga infera]
MKIDLYGLTLITPNALRREIVTKATENRYERKYIGFVYSRAFFVNKKERPNITEEPMPAK